MLKPASSSTSLSSSSCNAALTRKLECRLLGASTHSSSRFTISIRRRNDAVSCEGAGASSLAPIVTETKDACGGIGKSAAGRIRPGSLTEDGLSYKEKFIVRCYEVGDNKTATVETIANLLQEVACNHVRSLGFSTDGFGTTTTMRKLRLIWATARMHIEVYKYPAWSDVVEVETWYESEGPIWTRRDWILTDYATHEVIGRATSKFVMMNQHTRRLEKVNDDVRKEYLSFCPREPRVSLAPGKPLVVTAIGDSAATLEEDTRGVDVGREVRPNHYKSSLDQQLAFPEEKNGSLKKIAKLEDAAQYSRQGLVPRRADLDMNHHVNNVAYIGWILESMPQEIIDTHELETITLDYRRECRQDDVVDSHTSPESAEDTKASQLNGSNGTAAEGEKDFCQFLHLLRLSGDGLEISRGRSGWRKKPTRRAYHSV